MPTSEPRRRHGPIGRTDPDAGWQPGSGCSRDATLRPTQRAPRCRVDARISSRCRVTGGMTRRSTAISQIAHQSALRLVRTDRDGPCHAPPTNSMMPRQRYLDRDFGAGDLGERVLGAARLRDRMKGSSSISRERRLVCGVPISRYRLGARAGATSEGRGSDLLSAHAALRRRLVEDRIALGFQALVLGTDTRSPEPRDLRC